MESMEKVQELERELEELKLKVQYLEAGLNDANKRIESMSASQITTSKVAEPGQQAPKTAPAYASNVTNTTYSYAGTYNKTATYMPAGNQAKATTYANTGTYNAAPQYAQQPAQNKVQSTESWIGKILMGALASILIFIALITFAKLLLPFFNDTVKIALMFIASFALTGTGFVLNRKQPANTFYKALLACGSACIYLSILVTGIHFKSINSIVMYVLIALWAVLMIFIKTGRDDPLFFSIGNLGYLVSIIFTAGLKDESLIIPMLVYAVMISAVYQIMYWKNEKLRVVQSTINISVMLLFLIIMSFVFDDITQVHVVGITTILLGFVGFIFYSISDLFHYKKTNFYIASANVFGYLAAYYIINIMLELPAFVTYAVILIPAIIFEAINIYWRSSKIATNESIVNIILTSMMFLFVVSMVTDDGSIIIKSGMILVAFSLITIYGIIAKDSFFKTQGWVLVCICVGLGFISDGGLFFCTVALILALASLVVEGYVLNNSVPFKILSYISVIGCIEMIALYISDHRIFFENMSPVYLTSFFIISAFNIAMTLTGFYKTKERNYGRDVHVVMDVFNLILIFLGVSSMHTVDTTMRVIYMVIVFALACINLPVRGRGNKGRYLYTGLKFGFLIFYSLWIFRVPSFIISISMIAFSVLCIALGFKNRLLTKELRIFGLVTTLLFVVKFIVVDISFDSTVMKALSYLIAGILCFGISAIYNHFEKTTGMKQPQQFQQPQQPQQFQQQGQ